jgi:hypothetical protein
VSALPNPPNFFPRFLPSPARLCPGKKLPQRVERRIGRILSESPAEDGQAPSSLGIFSASCLIPFFLNGWLLQIRSHNLNQIVGGFFGGFCFSRHVIADVVLHQFAHEAVDGAARGGKALQDVGATLVLIQGATDGFELSHDFLGAREQIQFFSR